MILHVIVFINKIPLKCCRCSQSATLFDLGCPFTRFLWPRNGQVEDLKARYCDIRPFFSQNCGACLFVTTEADKNALHRQTRTSSSNTNTAKDTNTGRYVTQAQTPTPLTLSRIAVQAPRIIPDMKKSKSLSQSPAAPCETSQGASRHQRGRSRRALVFFKGEETNISTPFVLDIGYVCRSVHKIQQGKS